MSRNTFFLVGLFIVVVLYGFVFWVGLRLGAVAGWLTLFVLIPVNIWVFDKIPKPPAQTQEESEADERAWTAFFEKLLYRVGPVALAGWLFYRWLEKL